MHQFHRGLQKWSLSIFCFQCERKCCVAALCTIHRHTLSTILILLPNAASCVVPSSQPPPTPPQKQRKKHYFLYMLLLYDLMFAVIVYCIVQVSQVILRSKFLAVNHLKGKTVSQVYLALVVCREIILELRIPTSTVSLQM